MAAASRLAYLRSTHFWGPLANWGFVLAGLSELLRRRAEDVNARMTGTLAVYSLLFMRFAYMVQPRNWFLFSCHFCNAGAQGLNLARYSLCRRG